MPLVLIPDGPGTTIDLREGFQGLPVAPRGTSAFVQVFVSGPTSHAALALSPETARLIGGEEDDDFIGNLAMGDLYSEDSPPVLIGRITDGLEVQARQDLWDRNPARSMLLRTAGKDRAPFAVAKANNGGRWGGRKRVMIGEVAAIATDLTASTLDISTAAETPDAGDYLEDVFKDALLYIEGDDDNSPYTIESNDTNGVLTIKGEFSSAAQAADGTGAIDGRFRIVLGVAKELSVVIGEDSVAGAEFSLKGLRKFGATADWEVVTSYSNLQLGLEDRRPWLPTIADGESISYQLAIETDYEGATVEEKLPCNFCEVPIDINGSILEFQWWRFSAGQTNTGNPYVDDVSAVDADSIEPHVIDLTFTGAGAGTVDITWPDGTVQRLAAAFAVGTLYTPDHPQLAAFRVRAGTVAAVAGDTLKVRIQALPSDLAQREAFVYPIALSLDGNPNIRQRIVSSTYKSVTVRSDLDFATMGAVASEGAETEGTADITTATWVLGTTLIFTPDAGAPVTFTSPGVSNIAPIIAALQAIDVNNVFIFSAAPGGLLHVQLRKSFGSTSRIQVGAGTANGLFGFTGTEDEFGTDGVPMRIEGRFPMWGGYDGVAPATARYLIALDLSTNIFKRWLNTNLGLVRLATPDVYDADVKEAVAALTGKHGWHGVAEFNPSFEAVSTPGESVVADMQANESESDFMEHYFPNRLKFFNVAKTKLITRSCTGLIMGVRSRLANVGVDGEKGLHIAAANKNEQGLLSPRAQGLPDDLGRWTPPIGLMNDHGIVPILWDGPDIYLFGNRMYSKGRTSAGKRFTITERAVYYHVSRDLFVTTRPFIFKSISAKRLGEVTKSLREKMKAYWTDGWFSDVLGPGFEQQVVVEVPQSLNPPENLLEGLVAATVQFRPRPALENLKIIISPTQLTSEG